MSELDSYSKQLDHMIADLEYFNSPFRVRIFMILNIHGEMSLPDLAKKLGKAKSTISKHLSELEAINWVTIREEKVRGRILKKIYRMNVDYVTPQMMWNLEEIVQNYPEEEANQFIGKLLKKKRLLIKFLSLFNSQVEEFIEKLENRIKVMDQSLVKDYFISHQILSNAINLTEEEAIEYRDTMKKFHTQFIKKIEEERKKNRSELPKRDYMAFQVVYPMKKIIEEL